jgi:glutamate 5-kinase
VLVIDDGAVKALRSGKSLLPAGVRSDRGPVPARRRDCRAGPEWREVARGLVAYDAADAERIAGRNTKEIETILGYAGRAAMVHRDDMALRGE